MFHKRFSMFTNKSITKKTFFTLLQLHRNNFKENVKNNQIFHKNVKIQMFLKHLLMFSFKKIVLKILKNVA